MPYKRKIAGLALVFTLLIGSGGAFAAQDPEYDRITDDMTTIRELELLQPLDIEMQTREELQTWLLETVEDVDVDDIADQERILTFLGFIDPGTDILEMELDLLGEQVAGYYDPEMQSMVVVMSNDGDELSANDEITFAHEVVHALQDQHFDLMAVQGDIEALTDDEYLSVNALIEGDATVAQVLYMIEYPALLVGLEAELAEYESPALDEAPLFYVETLLFPYDQGALFAMAIYEDGGWDAVDAMYEDPPTTTEQILHPEKYLEGESAIDVTVEDPSAALGDDWRVIDENAFGEFLIDVFLRNGGAPENAANDAANGWGGDAYYIVGNEDETAMSWVSVWDTGDDAEEFFDTLVRTEAQRLNADVDTLGAGNHVRFAGGGYLGEIFLDDDSVTYVLAENEQTLDRLVEASGAD